MSEYHKELGRNTASEVFESREAVPEMFRKLNSMQRVAVFHAAMRFERPSELVVSPSVTHRELRSKLLIEEVMETIAAMGFELYNKGTNKSIDMGVGVRQREGAIYNPIETADGLADIKVIVNGTADVLGIPQYAVDYEVFCSNMTKLDESGAPIINRCVYEDKDTNPSACHIVDNECQNPEHFIDPSKPNGKILKPVHYTPANILRVLYRECAPTKAMELLDHLESPTEEVQ